MFSNTLLFFIILLILLSFRETRRVAAAHFAVAEILEVQTLTHLQGRINDSSAILFSNHKEEFTQFLSTEGMQLSDSARAALSHTMNEIEYFAWTLNRKLLRSKEIEAMWLNPILILIDIKIRVDSKLSGADTSLSFERSYPELTILAQRQRGSVNA